jgi:hypothetical protein
MAIAVTWKKMNKKKDPHRVLFHPRNAVVNTW